ncbi:MAG TPA: hypothetical protein V6D18_15325, partial [Thermosynechococcaceae cyanobacterium]
MCYSYGAVWQADGLQRSFQRLSMVVDEHDTDSTRSLTLTLTGWVGQVVGIERVQSRWRKNHLHLLLESQPCPDADQTVARLVQAFATTSLEQILPPDVPVHRVVVYGRVPNRTNPEWTRSFHLQPPASS